MTLVTLYILIDLIVVFGGSLMMNSLLVRKAQRENPQPEGGEMYEESNKRYQ